MESIRSIIEASIAVKQKLLEDETLLQTIQAVAGEMIQTFRQGGKVLFCGNGGSAADAQHLAAEFSGRFYKDRPALFAEALHVNSSYLTAVANDYSYNDVYARLLDGFGRQGDIVVGISTSGNSANIIYALEKANAKGMTTVGFTGQTGGQMKAICKYLINIPATITPRIQESHILVGHIICEMVESTLFPG